MRVQVMKKLNIIAWILLVKILILSLGLLFYDQMETKKQLLETERSLENAVQVNSVLQKQVEQCGK